jgi:hypothetical protein
VRPCDVCLPLATQHLGMSGSMACFGSPQAVLLGTELALCLTAVALFGFAYPDRLRTRLWENGGVEGWNSNPRQRIYFYANHQEPPEIPMIWSERSTESLLAVAVLSLVVCLARAVTFKFRYIPRFANIGYDLLLCSFWILCAAVQNSSDRSDPEHPSKHPWYLTRGCAVAWDANQAICRTAQASFAVSILAAVFYGGRLLAEAVSVMQDAGRPAEERMFGHKMDPEELAVLRMVEYNRVQEQALSPLLAFFPDSPPPWI